MEVKVTVSARIQQCPMCLEVKPVVKSHLMPAALYNYCRSETGSPTLVIDGVAMVTDRHLQAYLLCNDCEDVLNKGGESWALDKFARIERTFPFYELLKKGPAAFEDDRGALFYTSLNPHIPVGKLTHFAMGIFWKAAVHSWSGSTKEPMIALGPYAESIRVWLLGESAFPRHVYLSVNAAPSAKAQIVFHQPHKHNLRDGIST